MAITFYPHDDDVSSSHTPEKIEILQEAAQRYKAHVLDVVPNSSEIENKKRSTPRDIVVAYNWDELAKLLRTIREMPEITQANKLQKADYLTKIAEIYESLRGAKMPKLEAVRLALINEVKQLRSSAA